MSRLSLMPLAAAVVIGIASVSAISTDAFARPGRGVGGVGGPGVGVGHVHRHPVARGAAVGVAVGTAAVVGASYARPHCVQSIDVYGHPYTHCY